MKSVWSSGVSKDVKLGFLVLARLESVLLYGSECWTLTPTLQKSLDGCYTGVLRMVVHIDWRDHRPCKPTRHYTSNSPESHRRLHSGEWE